MNVDVSGALRAFVVSAASTPLASFRAKVLEQTAAFYRLPQRIAQQQAAIAAAAGKRGSLPAEQQARLVAAENGLAAARSQWASTDRELAAVNAQLQAGDTSRLISSVPRVVAGMVGSRQLVDGVDRALGNLKSLAPAPTSTLTIAGFSIGGILLLAGIGYALSRRR